MGGIVSKALRISSVAENPAAGQFPHPSCSQAIPSIPSRGVIEIFSFYFCLVDTKKFIIDCVNHPSNQRLQLTPRLLEPTNVVRVENLPPGVDDYQLQLFFENPFNGGGRVARVECFPEESSALVEFCDGKGTVSLPTIPGITQMFGHCSIFLNPQAFVQ